MLWIKLYAGQIFLHCQYLEHFSTYRVIFQTRPCIFSTKLLNFCLHYSDHWSRPGSPPPPPHRSLCQSGWFFSPLCFARKCLPGPSHMCSVHFKWSVICNEIFDCLIFGGLIWSKSLITWSQSGHKKTFQTLLSSFKRYYQGRKYTLQSKDSYYL